jgi:general secretion pathway protein A
MYLTFYGLKERPFNASPDPRFLCLTPGHREALAQLVYSVQENRGFLVLTGEVGTGKTTLLHALLQRLDGSKTAVAYVFNTTLRFDGLLEYVLEELGVPTPQSSPAQRLIALRRLLLERRRAGQRTVLILDEAQNFDAATLERIRMLSNLETPTEKILQILLVGQPELRAKLERPELRQLQQRIELQCSLSPLSREQIGDYIQTRLRVAGARDLDLFTDRARDRIAAYSRGIPRRVNILCDHCLVIGYAEQRRRIEADIVGQAIASIGGPRRSARRPVSLARAAWERWVVGGVATAVVLVGIAVAPLRGETSPLLTFVRHLRELFVR